MALHDTIVKKLKNLHEAAGDNVTAELRGYPKPPKFQGPRGRNYIPDVYVYNRKEAYEVKEYWAYRNAVPKLKAIQNSGMVARLTLVLCSGTPAGVPRVKAFLEAHGVDCDVISHRELQLR